MAENTPADPFALMRNWVGEWEKAVNQHGAEWLAKPEVAQAMQGMTAAGLDAQAANQAAMARMLAAANLPSKADVEALGTRLAGIEAALARIEAGQRGGEVSAPAVPRPKRTRTPGRGSE